MRKNIVFQGDIPDDKRQRKERKNIAVTFINHTSTDIINITHSVINNVY